MVFSARCLQAEREFRFICNFHEMLDFLLQTFQAAQKSISMAQNHNFIKVKIRHKMHLIRLFFFQKFSNWSISFGSMLAVILDKKMQISRNEVQQYNIEFIRYFYTCNSVLLIQF